MQYLSARKLGLFILLAAILISGCQTTTDVVGSPTTVVDIDKPVPTSPPVVEVEETTLSAEIKPEWRDWYEEDDFVEFLNQAFIDQMVRDPETITEIGLSSVYGLQDDLLANSSAAFEMETFSLLQLQLEKLYTFDRDTLSKENLLNYDLFAYDLEEILLGMQYCLYDFPINQTIGLHTGLVEFMTDRHPIRNLQTIDAYIARIKQFPQKVEGWLEFFEDQKAAGIKMPDFNQKTVVWQINNLVQGTPEQNVLYTSLQDRMMILSSVHPDVKEEMLEETAAAIEQFFIPAYEALIAGIESYETLPADTSGLVYQPGGADAYQYALYHHTTTDLTAEEIHKIGLSEVDRIQAEMAVIMDDLGVPDGTLSQRMYNVAGMSGIMPVNTEAERQAILDEYQRMIDYADQNLSEYFDLRPNAGVTVRPIAGEGASGAYYVSGALDGSRPGIFYVGLGSDKPRYGMATLAYHEAIPGHHFQSTIQNELTGLPYFRNGLHFTAFSEGWALYAEYLMKEAGFYESNPYGDLGRLQMELFRAVRLVVDTGLHHYGWSRDEAVIYLEENTGLPRGYVEFEIERYILWPGQATSYKIGMLKMLEMRALMETELGDAFEIKEFHNLMLAGGEYPLSMMEQIVGDYLEGE